MSIAEGISGTFRLFGMKGVILTSASRIFGRPKEITVKPGVSPYPLYLRLRTSDISVYNDLLLNKAYDIGMPDFRPKTIVDAGANVGMATIYFANKYPGAKIIAVEPEPSNFAMLVKNVAGYANVVTVNAALSDSNGHLNLGLPRPGFDGREKWAFEVVTSGGVTVRAMTVPTLMTETGLDDIDLFKVDIEGSEREVFRNCQWIDRVKVIVIELHDRLTPGCSEAVNAVTKEFISRPLGEMTVLSRTAL